MSSSSDPHSSDDRLTHWRSFLDGVAPDGIVRPAILASWRRSRDAGVDAETAEPLRPRVPDDELARRLAASAELLDVARPHLEWLSTAYAALPHVACLVDADGIVLCSVGSDAGAMRAAGLVPGHDWSEARVGTNGAGTALVAGESVTIDGPEHYARAWHGYTCTGAPVRGADGAIVGAIDFTTCFASGASERLVTVGHAAFAIGRELRAREAERSSGAEALRASEARFRSAFDHSSVGAAITGPDGRWLRVNRALAEILGYDEEELCGRTFQSLTHPDDLERNMEFLRRAMAGEIDRYRMEKRLAHADGRWVWGLLSVSVVRDDAGTPRYLISEFQDLTDRKRAEALLRESEERYRRVIETAHEGICIVDTEGAITYANARFAALLGFGAEELLGRPVFELMEPEAAFEARTRFARRRRGIAEVDERAFRRADGSTLWALESASSLVDAEGRFVGAVYMLTDVTERREAERRVTESERYFRALTERSSELVAVLDAQAQIRYVNPAFARQLGYPAEEAVGRAALDLIEPGDRARIAGVIGELLTTPGAVVAAEYSVHRSDGGLRIINAVASNLLDDDAVRGIVVNAHDVTDRRRAEDALRESEARFAHIAANIPGVVYQWVYRADGTAGYTFVSEGARAMFGVAPEDAVRDGRMLVDLIHPDEVAEFVARARGAAEVPAPFGWEGRVVLGTGDVRFVHVVARSERQPDGSVLSDGLILDVTELRRATQRLEESEQRYRSLFDHNPDAVFSLDMQGRFVSANPACQALAGYGPTELLHASFAPLIAEEDRDTALENFALAAAGTATSYELTVLHRTGRRVRIAATKMPIVVGGRVVGVFGIAKDLTVQGALEQQLRQSQKMEAVGRLAGGVAHDFNNLLTVIGTNAELALAELPAESAAATDLREVQAAAERAAALTRQLLAFSRQQLLKARRVDANRTVMDVGRMLRRLVGEDITLQVEPSPVLWPVHVDPGQLEQVLLNLAVNARDAMPAGGTLSLRTANRAIDAAGARPELAAGDYVAIEVEDTGLGIAPDVLPHIFEPFYTTKGPGQGTGLGLATVYGIVQQSGGHVLVDSAPGTGSRFTVLLPRTEAPRDEAAAAAAAAPPRGAETILLVEDDAAVRGAVRRMLGRLGYTVLEAGGGTEALRVAAEADARDARIDLVLTDVVMPEQNGRALGERLAEHWPGVKVLYMSGYTDDEIFRRGLMQSGTSFLQKPFSAESLARALRAALDG